jgi:hypothetical protein
MEKMIFDRLLQLSETLEPWQAVEWLESEIEQAIKAAVRRLVLHLVEEIDQGEQ